MSMAFDENEKQIPELQGRCDTKEKLIELLKNEAIGTWTKIQTQVSWGR